MFPDFETLPPEELYDFISKQSGYAFQLDIPLRWTCSEEALRQQVIPFSADTSKEDAASRAIHLPQRVGVTAERLAEMYTVSNFDSKFMFTFCKNGEQGEMFDVIFYFLVHYGRQQTNTARRPSKAMLDMVIGLDKLARLLWEVVGWERIVMDGWIWEDKLNRGEFDEVENLSSLATLGLAPRTGATRAVETEEDQINEELQYRSPVERFLNRMSPRGARQSNAGFSDRSRETFGNDNGRSSVNKIPEWMLKGSNL